MGRRRRPVPDRSKEGRFSREHVRDRPIRFSLTAPSSVPDNGRRGLTVPPRPIVTHPVGRVGDHQVRHPTAQRDHAFFPTCPSLTAFPSLKTITATQSTAATITAPEP